MKKGFTIIETSLVVAISGLLAVGLMIGWSRNINIQRYNDSVETFKSDIQAVFDEVQNPTNTRVKGRCLWKGADSVENVPDNLNGTERPVAFGIKEQNDHEVEIVHSLAKWKRYALGRYGFAPGQGLYTDMNAIRRDEYTDNIHSIYVDQWDWERIIKPEDRNEEYLKHIVQAIVNTICNVNHLLKARFPVLDTEIKREVTFVTAQELEDMYPGLTAEQREYEFAKIHKTIFVMKIGDKLKSGVTHGHRAPDYDDWELNGDIIFWNEILQKEFEISSMGIRVNRNSIEEQLKKAGCEDRKELPYHKMLLNGELPDTIGGGIGQSRLCMLLIGTAHIGEVQASLWNDETTRVCKDSGVLLL